MPSGVETAFSFPLSTAVRAEVTARYALPPRYLLQVGTVQPRKNYVTTLRALRRIPIEQRIPLVVVGGFCWEYHPGGQAGSRVPRRGGGGLFWLRGPAGPPPA